MAKTVTVSETILDQLAAGATVKELKDSYGYSRSDIITAALFGVAELREEYINLLRQHGKLKR